MTVEADRRVKPVGMEPAGDHPMKKSAFKAFIEDEINVAAGKIIVKDTTSDDVALGRLNVLQSLRRTLDNKSTAEDVGTWGAINDILQQLGVLDSRETIFSGIEA
jgi:hypothetical protein